MRPATPNRDERDREQRTAVQRIDPNNHFAILAAFEFHSTLTVSPPLRVERPR